MTRSKGGVADRVRAYSDIPKLRTSMVEIVDRVQSKDPAVQVLAPALALVCFADALGLSPIEIVTRIQRMVRDVDGPFSNEWQAMRSYAKGELKV